MKKFSTIILAGLFRSVAFADSPPTEVIDCDGRKIGDLCTTSGTAGSCQQSTCSRLDYSQGSPPKGTIDYPCVKCVPGAANNTPAPAKVEPPTKTGGCAVDPLGRGGALAALMMLSGAAVLLRRKRPD